MLSSGCSSTRERPHNQKNTQLEDQFDASVEAACDEFVESLGQAFRQLEADVSTGFRNISDQFVQLCLGADGYLERAKGEEEARPKLQDFIRAAVTGLMNDSLAAYTTRYL